MNSDIDGADLAAKSRTYRAAHHLTQRELATQLRTSPGLIGELEANFRVRSRRVAMEIQALSRSEDGTA